MVCTENSFSANDLLEYAEMLLRGSKLLEAASQPRAGYYRWLTAKHIHNDVNNTNAELEKIRPMLHKMSSESCAKIAVKLDDLTNEVESTAVILNTFKQLLIEHYTIQMIDEKVIKAKERGLKKNKMSKVHPALDPDKRQPTVSFILLL